MRTQRFEFLKIAEEIADELTAAESKFPFWPVDPLHAIAIINEEVGELNKAVLQKCYEPDKGVSVRDIRMEALQSAAMLIRFIAHIPEYTFKADNQV